MVSTKIVGMLAIRCPDLDRKCVALPEQGVWGQQSARPFLRKHSIHGPWALL